MRLREICRLVACAASLLGADSAAAQYPHPGGPVAALQPPAAVSPASVHPASVHPASVPAGVAPSPVLARLQPPLPPPDESRPAPQAGDPGRAERLPVPGAPALEAMPATAPPPHAAYPGQASCACPVCTGFAPCCGPPGCWKSNLVVFAAGDSWANRGDDDHANNFGMRAGLNSAWSLDYLPFRIQLGAAWGGYNGVGRDEADGDALDTTGIEQQLFVTAGVYRRSCVCEGRRISWGLVYDHLQGEAWGERAVDISLGQLRGQLGFAWNAWNELGVRGALEISDDRLELDGPGEAVKVGVIDHVQLYWRRNWDSGATTSLGFVIAEEPAEWGVAFEGQAPLSARLALYGSAVYLYPSTSAGDVAPNGVANSYSEETWNVTFGIVFYPGYKAVSPTVSGHPGLPLLPVAGNGSLLAKVPNGEF